MCAPRVKQRILGLCVFFSVQTLSAVFCLYLTNASFGLPLQLRGLWIILCSVMAAVLLWTFIVIVLRVRGHMADITVAEVCAWA